jgi:hypothetical protein
MIDFKKWFLDSQVVNLETQNQKKKKVGYLMTKQMISK